MVDTKHNDFCLIKESGFQYFLSKHGGSLVDHVQRVSCSCKKEMIYTCVRTGYNLQSYVSLLQHICRFSLH